LTYVITGACADIKDQSCVEVCPVDCIYEGTRMMYINADECIDCGACEPVCPTEAIYFDADLTHENIAFLVEAAALIQSTSASGGAKERGPIGSDMRGLCELSPQSDHAPSRPASPHSKASEQ